MVLFRPALLIGEMCSLGPRAAWFSKHYPRLYFLMQELPRINPIRKMEFAGAHRKGTLRQHGLAFGSCPAASSHTLLAPVIPLFFFASLGFMHHFSDLDDASK